MAEENTAGKAPVQRINSDPLILAGKPFVHDTRLSVDFLQGLLAIGWTREKILGVYTYLAPEDLEAALSHRAA